MVFLENGHARFCAAEMGDRDAVLMQFVSGFITRGSIPQDFEAAKPNLLPVIRSASYYSLSDLESQASGRDTGGLKVVATQNLAEDLVVGLAYDTEHSISFIYQESLGRWQAGFEEALSAARENLANQTDLSRMVQHSPGLFVGQWDDSYESSRMLLTDMIYNLRLDGDPIVCIPSRNQFWVTGSCNVVGIDSIVKFCEEDHFGAYPLSPDIFQLSDGKWTRFVPEAKALQDSLSSLKRRRLALDYSQQKKYLEIPNERDGIDVFVASFMMYEENATGRQYSTCVWSNGVDSLLPFTDEVILLVDPETKDRVSATWSILQSVAGNLMEELPDLFPERYRVRSFPSEAEVAELRRATSA